MSSELGKAVDSEQWRLQLVDELTAEQGSTWPENFKPGSFGCHELLDRTMLVAQMIERSVLSHPACILNPQWYALADQAATALHALYEHVGSEHLVDENGAG